MSEYIYLNNHNNDYFLYYNEDKIYNTKTNKFISMNVDKKGFLKININRKVYFYHLIKAEYLYPNIENKKYLLFKDGNKLNNNIDNYFWSNSQKSYLEQIEILNMNLINNQGCRMNVVEYITNKNVKVYFSETNNYKICELHNFLDKSIENPYIRNICDIGYLGDVDDIVYDKKIYNVWKNMIDRCYNPKNIQYGLYGGNGVYVDNNWHKYSEFYKWYNFHYRGKQVDIDKDILIEENKIYSEKTCVLVPKNINMLFLENDKRKILNIPVGIQLLPSKRYMVRIQHKSYGTFDTIEEAIIIRRLARLTIMKNDLNTIFKEHISNEHYELLMNL